MTSANPSEAKPKRPLRTVLGLLIRRIWIRWVVEPLIGPPFSRDTNKK